MFWNHDGLNFPWVLFDNLILWDRLLSRATEGQRGYRSLTGHDGSLCGGVFYVIVGIVRLYCGIRKEQSATRVGGLCDVGNPSQQPSLR